MAFSINIGVTFLYAEIYVVVYIIEVAHAGGLINLWFESDSLFMILAFTNVNLIRDHP